jgi:glycosyltransferase involved in cell wall biosynthesis
MIVRNEAAIIERCLASVAGVIDCYVIADTGSTDGTQQKIKDFFEAIDVPGIVVEFPFENFEHARNRALEAAEASSLAFDYLLFTDADMELVVNDRSAFDNLDKIGYLIKQKTATGLLYDNARLAKRASGVSYKGVTHEYVNFPGEAGRIPEAQVYFLDHACGSNRADKAARDIRLLLAGIENETDAGIIARYHFYLAQTYFETGEYEKSREHYETRVSLGGFEEEAWFSQMGAALCEYKLGNEPLFVGKMMDAWQNRPSRSEPLYHLAKHYLKTGKNDLAAMLCEEGLTIPVPDDLLFVETSVYERGFKEIFAIAGYYARDRKGRAFDMNNWLSLSRKVPDQTAGLATVNMPPYLVDLSTYMDSWQSKRIGFEPDAGWFCLNPSVARIGGYLDCVVRTVNYEVKFSETAAHYVTENGAPITTRNFYLRLNDDLEVIGSNEILPPVDMPAPRYKDIVGFEDLRLIEWNGQAYVNGTCCELEEDGWRNMVRGRINRDTWRIEELAVCIPDTSPRQAEKNWAPFIDGKELKYLYSYEPTKVLDHAGDTLQISEPAIRAKAFRGGSQLVPYEDGWLCCVHAVSFIPKTHRRIYYHRFVWFDRDMNLKRVSIPFVFNKVGFEFCAGMAWMADGKRLVLSYGVDDSQAWIGTVDARELSPFLLDVNNF